MTAVLGHPPISSYDEGYFAAYRGEGRNNPYHPEDSEDHLGPYLKWEKGYDDGSCAARSKYDGSC